MLRKSLHLIFEPLVHVHIAQFVLLNKHECKSLLSVVMEFNNKFRGALASTLYPRPEECASKIWLQ
jgi:hypothetical protein